MIFNGRRTRSQYNNVVLNSRTEFCCSYKATSLRQPSPHKSDSIELVCKNDWRRTLVGNFEKGKLWITCICPRVQPALLRWGCSIGTYMCALNSEKDVHDHSVPQALALGLKVSRSGAGCSIRSRLWCNLFTASEGGARVESTEGAQVQQGRRDQQRLTTPP